MMIITKVAIFAVIREKSSAHSTDDTLSHSWVGVVWVQSTDSH